MYIYNAERGSAADQAAPGLAPGDGGAQAQKTKRRPCGAHMLLGVLQDVL